MQSRVEVFLNQKSGSADGIGSQIVAGFRTLGVPCELVCIEPNMNITELARKAGGQQDIVVVSAGGDGTANSVAAGVVGTAATLGILPVGTLNHFAKDLGIPLELDQAIVVIGHQHRSTVDTGEVNGQLFVNNSSVGIYPEIVTERERLKSSGMGKWLSLVLASFRAFLNFHQITIKLTVDGEQITRRTPLLFVGNNEYKLEGTRIGTRDRLDCGSLFVYLVPGLTRLGVLRIAFAAIFGKVKEVPNYEQFRVSECTVDLNQRMSRVSLDGEVRRIKGLLHYRIRPASLNVCTPGSD